MGLFRYVALGDSSAVGVGAAQGGGYPEHLFQSLRRTGAPVGFLNLGVSGATTSDLVRGPLRQVTAKRPHLITVGIGNNDTWRMVPDDVFADNVRQLADTLAETRAQVLVCNLIDLALAPAAGVAQSWTGVPPAAFTDRARHLNGILAAQMQRPGFEVIDLFAFSQRELSAHPEYFSADGFHPSAEGYARWAELCLPSAMTALEAWRQRE
jgi:lysophospholipase L1-like esterase